VVIKIASPPVCLANVLLGYTKFTPSWQLIGIDDMEEYLATLGKGKFFVNAEVNFTTDQ
jgi:hypothetical protein